MNAKIVVRQQYDNGYIWNAYVVVVGSKYSCASIVAASKSAAMKAARGYCAQYRLTIVKQEEK